MGGFIMMDYKYQLIDYKYIYKSYLTWIKPYKS